MKEMEGRREIAEERRMKSVRRRMVEERDEKKQRDCGREADEER